jgi:glutamate carboxypeptidase
MTDLPAPGSLVARDELSRLRAHVEQGLPGYLDDLAALCSIDCGTYTPSGVDEVGRVVADRFVRLGATVEVRPDPDGRFGASVIGRFDGEPGAGPRILVIGHLDTVFDPGTAAARPFRIGEGIARGPGVTDMKGGFLSGLYALAALRSLAAPAPGRPLGGLPFERIVYLANPDEEIGSPSSSSHIRELAAESDVCLVLECARSTGEFVASRKGILDARVTVHGRAAHAGVEPEKGRSAIVAAAEMVGRLHGLNGRWPGVTVNVGVIGGGTRPNVVAELCRFEVDVRGVTREALEAAEAAVHAVLASPVVADVAVEVEVMARWQPMERLARSGRLADHAVALAGRLGFVTSGVSTGGASDANTTSGMGVPTLDGLGPVGGLDHSPDEYLEVASVVPRTTLLAALLLEIGRDPGVAAWRTGPA